MAMSLNYFDATTYHLATKVHDLDADTLKVALTNSQPSASNTVLANITEITAGNGYTAGGEVVPNTAVNLSGSTASLTGDNVTFTASSGSMDPFRYLVLYNDSAGSDELLGWWDYGSEVTLPDGASFTLELTSGILDVTHP